MNEQQKREYENFILLIDKRIKELQDQLDLVKDKRLYFLKKLMYKDDTKGTTN